MCSNFLFYHKDDKEIAGVKNLSDLVRVIRKGSGDQERPKVEGGLLVDLAGTSTLGEMYLDSEMDRHKTLAAVLPDLPKLDENALKAMQAVYSLTAPGYARDTDYHERLGFYARQFFRKRGRALVGYAESLHYGITEVLQSCHRDEQVLTPDSLAVTEWPLAEEGSQPIGWVDMFVVQKSCTGQKLEDAKAFIRFMTSNETYRAALMPKYKHGPRYLLPAYGSYYQDPAILKVAPLYPVFLPTLERAIPVSVDHRNTLLRQRAKDLDAKLPMKTGE